MKKILSLIAASTLIAIPARSNEEGQTTLMLTNLPYRLTVLGPLKDDAPLALLEADDDLPPLNPDDIELYLWNGASVMHAVGLAARYDASPERILISTHPQFSKLFPRLGEHMDHPFFLLITHNADGETIAAAFFAPDARPAADACPEERPFNCLGTCSAESDCRFFTSFAASFWLPIYREFQSDPSLLYRPAVINEYTPFSEAELLVEADPYASPFNPDSLRLFAVTDRIRELPGDLAVFDNDNRTLLLTIPRDALNRPLRGRILFLLAATNRQNLPVLFAFIVTPKGE